jgi:hypothetical protein
MLSYSFIYATIVSVLKPIIKQTIHYIKNKLTFVNVGDFAPFFLTLLEGFWLSKRFWDLQNPANIQYICWFGRNVRYFAVVICHTTTNFKFDQSVFAIHDSSPHILRSVRMTTHSTSLVTHGRDHWWTLYFANAFVSPGVNSRAESVPTPQAYARNGAQRRWLG